MVSKSTIERQDCHTRVGAFLNRPCIRTTHTLMRASSVIEVLSAAHLTRYVESNIFQQRGGLFLVAPPACLKSTMIKNALACYPDCLRLADLNVQTLGYIKGSFTEGKYTTMAFGEFEKLYQRNPATAKNIEGHLKAMVEEGFGKTSFEDTRAVTFESRIMVIGGITPGCYQRLFTNWMEGGFSRRFLWCSYQMDNPDAIADAIDKWRSLNFGKSQKEYPNSGSIPYTVTKQESTHIRALLKDQIALETPYILAKKIFCVLKWRHKRPSKAMEIFEDFSECLRGVPARLTL